MYLYPLLSFQLMKIAKNFFTQIEKEEIIRSIQEAEKETTAEIRIHLENICWTNPVKRAKKIFIKTGMHHTKYRNGVLFYFAVISKKLAIIGDKGIYEKVPEDVWDKMVKELIDAFRKNENKAETLCKCIKNIGDFLKVYFPVTNNENPNELSDEISFS